MDKTLKKEKDCQEQLDKEVHAQWSDDQYFGFRPTGND